MLVMNFPGRPPLIFGFKAIRSFSPRSSKDVTLLQCADLLASGLAIGMSAVVSGSPPTDQTRRALLSFAIALNLSFGERFSSWVVSENFVSTLGRALRMDAR